MEGETLEPDIRVKWKYPVPGMDSVVATVSGYHGVGRLKLIKLINQTGAHYVGNMSKSTSHLVCWQFNGRKYDLAKKLGTKVVNHRWFEDCMKAGKLLPESGYNMLCGQEVDPLSWEVPANAVETGHKKKRLPDQSRAFQSLDVDRSYSSVESLAQFRSSLRSENANSNSGSSDRTAKMNKLSREKHKLRELLQVKERPPLQLVDRSGRVMSAESKACISSTCHKSSLHMTTRNNSPPASTSVPTRKSRRLVKKSSCYDTILSDGVELDQIKENQPNQFNIVISSSSADCDSLNSESIRNEDQLDTGLLTSRNADKEIGRCESIGVEAVEEAGSVLGLPISLADVSCAICWTDFSSTRGVLSCGHRFCFSCIQDWADQMASKGKESTCPLCKACFVCITRLEDATSPDQKMFSQTLPQAANTSVVLLHGAEDQSFAAMDLAFKCHECRSGDTGECLLRCRACGNRWVHTFCLDPPLSRHSASWTCNPCNLRRRPFYGI
ncbi:uncharacterized protein LOC18434063 isoform X2 [Amborella trichopoda]|uniref:RING-type E3 ubiquitin transferase BRCA1 n=1 Tax=Amborella trichopoda TaxID=13333 RepID=W1PE21_AMBTC|nr:uncharacterized protein LOC18434063 isoform X2 [Amborella trichopoda]ERN05876.1 hypothetical protein AMTR_s00006p00265240 [Amborella trichopoda]|eukprot:XP_006844201.1 uncharacterized protein LOC18434063 isoform X2 [Amborella trichopoda]